jgi:PAS domain S-box-containing protein
MMERVQEKALESDEFHRQLEALNANLEESVRARTRALAESEAQYKTLVEHSPDAILIVQEGRVRFVSRAFHEIFGIPEEIATSSAFDLCAIFEPSSSDHLREQLALWERGESCGASEVFARDASGPGAQPRGPWQPHRVPRRPRRRVPADRHDGDHRAARAAGRDREAPLAGRAGGRSRPRLQQPARRILGRTQLLRHRDPAREIDEDLRVIEKAALDGRETVRRIQEFSRVRRDRRFTMLDMAEILRDAMEITRSRWKADSQGRSAGVTVSLETPACPPIEGNAAELREVFTNLILNAVDAMPQGGELTLSCRPHRDKVRVEVADTGLGMSDTVRRHLFDPFFSTKGVGGMGLGLSVAYGIVTRHGAAIEGPHGARQRNDVRAGLSPGSRGSGRRARGGRAGRVPRCGARASSSSTTSPRSPPSSRTSSPYTGTRSSSPDRAVAASPSRSPSRSISS